MSAVLIVILLQWPVHSVAHRDDALWANTALSAATINSNNGQGCVVNNCNEENDPHKIGNAWVGYFDPATNTIVGKKPLGYNEEKRIRLNGKTYRGAIGSLVLEARSENGTVTVEWVEADS